MFNWLLPDSAPQEFIDQFSEFHPLIAQLLYNRGFENKNQAELFFESKFDQLYDPFLFQDMTKAVARIWQAIDNHEKILIYGDYDADGVTSSAVIYKCLKILGADIDAYIPHREKDGYGLNQDKVANFIEAKIQLLITVDCGITNVAEIKTLKENNIDVILTDHHEPLPELPEAFAIIDPKSDSNYPFRELAGVGVAYKLMQAVYADEKIKNFENELINFGGSTGFLKWILDIVAIGTVADVMPMVDENRVLVKWGLLVLKQTRNIGLKKILTEINPKTIDGFTIGFQIAPRLNAAGRIESARLAFDLLVCENESEAETLAKKLSDLNKQRQKITSDIVIEAKNQLNQDANQSILFAYSENWPGGVVGLVAGRLCDEFSMPTIIMFNNNGKIVGSGRSIEGFNITLEGLKPVENLLQKFGGHSQACGFTLNSAHELEKFKQKLIQITEEKFKGITLKKSISVDAIINFHEVDFDLIAQIDKFYPFGEKNEKPIFLLKNLQVTAFDYIGNGEKHLRILAKQENNPMVQKFIGFSFVEKLNFELSVGDDLEVLAEINVNEWNGSRSIEYRIIDIKKINE